MNAKASLFLLSIVALSGSGPAFAKCSFAVKEPIICSQAKTAAIAFQKFGAAENIEPYNQQLLKEAQCGSPVPPKNMKYEIKIFNSGKTALPNGWVDVSNIIIVKDNGVLGYSGYVASGYLSGACEKFTPETEVIPKR
ncbi:hypothetical protein [Pseudomonas sp. GM18]|uniref:hypothetical protein n=1 Tax=Pseudomonas sp. GM18 TaxID=1144324 RepID=UPI0012FCBEC5|nr:hypothetical protein [Pseudomonas sp. GM18]